MSHLDRIANSYHRKPLPDLWIESACQQFELNWLLSHLRNDPVVIDLGFGDGINARPIATHSRSYTLLEGSSVLTKRAEKMLKGLSNVAIHETLFESWSPKENMLSDTIFANHVLEHVQDPRRILRRLKSWLRPGGSIVGIVPNALSIHRLVGVEMGVVQTAYQLSERDHLVGHQRVYDLDTLTHDLQISGYKVEELKGFFLKPTDNRQLLDLKPETVQALISLGDLVGPKHSANIGFVARSEP